MRGKEQHTTGTEIFFCLFRVCLLFEGDSKSEIKAEAEAHGIEFTEPLSKLAVVVVFSVVIHFGRTYLAGKHRRASGGSLLTRTTHLSNKVRFRVRLSNCLRTWDGLMHDYAALLTLLSVFQ